MKKLFRKCPYTVAVIVTGLILAVYGLLLNFHIVPPLSQGIEPEEAGTVAVASAIHELKAFFSPKPEITVADHFVPPEGEIPSSITVSGGTSSGPQSGSVSSGKASKEGDDSGKSLTEKEDGDEETGEEEGEENTGEENEKTEENTNEPVSTEDGSYSGYGPFTEVDDSYFGPDALFIGDSRVVGFGMYSGFPVTTYAKTGYAIHSVFDKPVLKTPLGSFTLPELMAAEPGKYKKIYIKFGLNEMGWGNGGLFEQAYYNVIDMLKYYQQDAVIYVMSILPVTAKKDADSSVFSNANINARNEVIRTVAENEHVCYLNINGVYTDEEGNMPSDFASDGIHLKAAAMEPWKDYLRTHAIMTEAIKAAQEEAERAEETEENPEVTEAPAESAEEIPEGAEVPAENGEPPAEENTGMTEEVQEQN
ncbi:MAG: hypothetical protein K5985_05275 [Lachnospiraceae bacterium]|nr:hypothetical protein [Lachnospiraceae bacterium]